MAAPVRSETPAKPRLSVRLHLWWAIALVVVALGGAGLAVAADRPANPVQRPELTYLADAAALPWIDTLGQGLDAVHNDATSLSGAGRDVLGRLQALDLAGSNDALAAGDQASRDVETLAAGLHGTLGQANTSMERWRLGVGMATLFDQIEGAISAADQLPTDWAGLAGTGRTVAGLVAALMDHDRTISQVAAAAGDRRWADALDLLHGTAADALDIAAAARDQLARATTVNALDDLLARERAYDAALIALYQYLADGGAQSGDQFSLLQAAVAQAQAKLPADNGALVAVVAETTGLPIAGGLLAMEQAHGAINDALEAIHDARFGAPPIDGGPQQTPAP